MILKINNQQITGFTKININLIFDSVASTFSISRPYQNTDEQFNKAFVPISYPIVEVIEGEQTILTGILPNQNYTVSAKATEVTLAGYSTAGMIEDCQAPQDAFPLQFDQQNLSQIAKKLADLLLPKVNVLFSPNAIAKGLDTFPYSTIAMEETETIKGFLTKLAVQRGLIIRHNEKGELLFTLPDSNDRTIATIEEGRLGEGVTISAPYNGQSIHSDITAMGQSSLDNEVNVREATVTNSGIITGNVIRPKIITQDTGEGANSEDTAKTIRSAEYKTLQVRIFSPTWKIDDRVLIPGDIVEIKAPSVRIPNLTRFMVLTNRLVENSTQKTSNIVLVPHETYTLEQVEKYW